MKTLSNVIILGIGFLLSFGSPARAQWEGMGEAVKKGATDAAQQELLKKAGVPTAQVAAATPGAPTGAAATPAEAPKATPAAVDAPADAPGADTGAPNAPAGD